MEDTPVELAIWRIYRRNAESDLLDYTRGGPSADYSGSDSAHDKRLMRLSTSPVKPIAELIPRLTQYCRPAVR